MTMTSALPQSPTTAAAAARVAELRREAEQSHLVRAARTGSRRRGPAWPAAVAVALRESLRSPGETSTGNTVRPTRAARAARSTRTSATATARSSRPLCCA